MQSERSNYGRRCHDRRCSSRCEASMNGLGSGRNRGTGNDEHGERFAPGREGRGRLDGSRRLYQRRCSMGGCSMGGCSMGGLDDAGFGSDHLGMGGSGGIGIETGMAMGMGGGLGDAGRGHVGGFRGGMGGFPRSSAMPHGHIDGRQARASPMMDRRMAYINEDIPRPCGNPFLRLGPGVRGVGSQDQLLGGRRGSFLSGRMGPCGDSRHASLASSIFDPHRMDRTRMPYGPPAHGMGNYQSPYVEDYESEMEAEMMGRAMMERGLEQREGYDGFYRGYGAARDLGGPLFY